MKTLVKAVAILSFTLLAGSIPLQGQSENESKQEEKDLKKIHVEIERILKENTTAMDKERLRMIEEINRQNFLTQKEVEQKLMEARELEKMELEGLLDIEKNSSHLSVRSRDPLFIMPGNKISIQTHLAATQETSSLNIHKEISDLTFSTQFSYQVQEGSRTFSFMAAGSVSDGTIGISLLNPEGKLIHKFEVSPLADVNWSQKFRWGDEDAAKNAGSWTIAVEAKEASGRYEINIRAN